MSAGEAAERRERLPGGLSQPPPGVVWFGDGVVVSVVVLTVVECPEGAGATVVVVVTVEVLPQPVPVATATIMRAARRRRLRLATALAYCRVRGMLTSGG